MVDTKVSWIDFLCFLTRSTSITKACFWGKLSLKSVTYVKFCYKLYFLFILPELPFLDFEFLEIDFKCMIFFLGVSSLAFYFSFDILYLVRYSILGSIFSLEAKSTFIIFFIPNSWLAFEKNWDNWIGFYVFLIGVSLTEALCL